MSLIASLHTMCSRSAALSCHDFSHVTACCILNTSIHTYVYSIACTLTLSLCSISQFVSCSSLHAKNDFAAGLRKCHASNLSGKAASKPPWAILNQSGPCFHSLRGCPVSACNVKASAQYSQGCYATTQGKQILPGRQQEPYGHKDNYA